MPDTQQTFDSRSPADGRVVATFPIMDAAAVGEAVDRARIAASWWGDLSFGERKKYLLRFKSILARRADELAELVHQENGKPTDDALLEILCPSNTSTGPPGTPRRCSSSAASARAADRQPGRPPGLPTAGRHRDHRSLELSGLHPDGLHRLCPGGRQRALVFKPSEYTPLVGQWIVDAVNEAIPQQPVAQLITGAGTTGAAPVSQQGRQDRLHRLRGHRTQRCSRSARRA